ncbi:MULTISPECIES: hypothetical protein [unclassified Rhizobium]|uniref:hypothetical protein n=1 Tax=unclassified Rhizobium TaxID=2613769 RepID=UPI00382C0674
MSRERSEMENMARQLFRDHKRVLDLVTEPRPGSGFALAVQRLFGESPAQGKLARIGNRGFLYSGLAHNLVSFLPEEWREEFDKAEGPWRGCENWWSGYPFIAFVEWRGDGGTDGYLKLNMEVGPISNHKVRKDVITTIKAAALAARLERIQFQAGAADKGRLYSRFLRKNSAAVNNIHDTDEMERKLVKLIADFRPEFELVASVISQYLRQNDLS